MNTNASGVSCFYQSEIVRKRNVSALNLAFLEAPTPDFGLKRYTELVSHSRTYIIDYLDNIRCRGISHVYDKARMFR